MKTKLLIFLSVCALITLSFTFASLSGRPVSSTNENSVKTSIVHEEPAGGFISEDKL